jgi:DNA-binding NtrC family response regulator
LSKTILIVDDDEDQHVILGTLFSHYGYSTVHAHCLSEARAILAETAPDLVVLDIRLNWENGLDLLNVLHATDAKVPVVVCTSDALASFRYPAAVASAAAWIVKPTLTSNILPIVSRLLSSTRPA